MHTYLTVVTVCGHHDGTAALPALSKSLAELPEREGLVLYPGDEPLLLNEDVQLSGLLRPMLEKRGIKFAPLSVARDFALEYMAPKLHDDLKFETLFGIHGQTRKLITANRVRFAVSKARVSDTYRDSELAAFLGHSGYDVIFADGQQ